MYAFVLQYVRVPACVLCASIAREIDVGCPFIRLCVPTVHWRHDSIKPSQLVAISTSILILSHANHPDTFLHQFTQMFHAFAWCVIRSSSALYLVPYNHATLPHTPALQPHLNPFLISPTPLTLLRRFHSPTPPTRALIIRTVEQTAAQLGRGRIAEDLAGLLLRVDVAWSWGQFGCGQCQWCCRAWLQV